MGLLPSFPKPILDDFKEKEFQEKYGVSAKDASSSPDYLNSIPDYVLGNTLSGATSNQLEALFDYKRNKDLQSQAEKFNAEQAVLERAFSADEALKARDFNSNEAKLQRDWETAMSNSAYSRAANDIKSMGYNPAVLFSQYANMASTPSGASASGVAASAGSGARSSGGHTGSSGSGGLGSLIGSIITAVAGLAIAGIKASSALDVAHVERKSYNRYMSYNTNHNYVNHKYNI